MLLFVGRFISGELSFAPLTFDSPSLGYRTSPPASSSFGESSMGVCTVLTFLGFWLGQAEFKVGFFFSIYIHSYFLKPCAHREHRNLKYHEEGKLEEWQNILPLNIPL